MSRRMKPKKRKVDKHGNRIGGDAPHVRFYRFELQSAAYRSLSVSARALLVELKALYNGRNNGDLFLSCRKAAERLNCSKSHAAALFLELADRGFIRPKVISAFNLKAEAGQGKATTWILTEFPIGNALQGTKEFMRWRPSDEGAKNHLTVHGGGPIGPYGGQLAPKTAPTVHGGGPLAPIRGQNRSTGVDTDRSTMGGSLSDTGTGAVSERLTQSGKPIELRPPVPKLSSILIENRPAPAKREAA